MTRHDHAAGRRQQQPPQQLQYLPAATESKNQSTVGKWVAQFDYTAADETEVSFADGDIIVDVESVGDGWVKGTVEKTGASGMIPSNYVEKH